MSTKKQKRRAKGNRQTNAQSPPPDKQVKGWTRKQVVIVLVLVLGGILVLGLIHHTTRNAPDTVQTRSTTDAHGRSPGDPHYGHSHP